MSFTGLGLGEYRAHTTAQHVVHGVVIGYRLTLRRAPLVETTHSELDATLPPGRIRVAAGEHELIICSMAWDGRWDELDGHVRGWILEHVDLRGVPLTSTRRRDPLWRAAWRDANPWA
ncbi:hypothetical protein [Brachybacterium phenoliresistens]|uniref:hypothetical protein n=1 Tax=Brachybacterium phenoliresistens TaxID=396014 RepID=UPI0031D94DE2